MRCPYCKINNPASNITCFNCNKPLNPIESHVTLEEDFPEKQHFQKTRSLFFGLSLFIESLKGKWKSWDLRYGFFSRAWLAGWLSLLPGLGQLYNRQKVKALILFVTFVILVSGIIVLVYSYVSNWLLYATFFLIAYSFMDGFLTNLKYHQSKKTTLRQKLSVVFYGLFLFGTTIAIGQWILYPAYRFVYMNNNNLYPVIQHSDRIAINRVPYWFNEPKRGDLVWYETNQFTAIDYSQKDNLGESKENKYVFAKGSNMERILGLPGETVKFKNNIVYINGVEVAQEFQPLVKGNTPEGMEIYLDKDSYYILMSTIPKFGDTISDSIVQYGVFELFKGQDASAIIEPHKAIIRDDENWLKACVIKRDQIIGKAWFIYDPPPRRRFF